MLFDEKAFAVTLRKLISDGDRDAVATFLTEELNRIEDCQIVVDSGGCCCGKSIGQLQQEDLDWQRNRVQGQIRIYSELANFYREGGDWTRCFEVYRKLYVILSEAGLAGTEVHAKILVNEAYAQLDYGESSCAFERAQAAEELLAQANSKDGSTWSMLYNLFAVIYREWKDEEGARRASRMAVERIESASGTEAERAEMLLNHASALQRLGNSQDALEVVERVLKAQQETSYRGMLYFSALNLKAMILYEMKDYAGSAEAFETLILEAKETGALSSQLPMVCRNCSKMYALAGCEEKAHSYAVLAETI